MKAAIMKKPYFSVVIPTFNHAEFLKRALASVINQVYQNFEIIIVDNNSEDHTEEVISNFDDNRISLYKIDNQGVIGLSRNLGIKKSKGDWIAFLDSDDFWYRTKLGTIANFIEKKPYYDVICNDELLNYSSKRKKKFKIYGPLSNNTYAKLLVYGNKLSTSATSVRKSFVDNKHIRFNERTDFVTVEDYDFWLKLAFVHARFAFIHKFEGEYSVHESNNSNRTDIHNKNTLAMLTAQVYNIQNYELDREKLWK